MVMIVSQKNESGAAVEDWTLVIPNQNLHTPAAVPHEKKNQTWLERPFIASDTQPHVTPNRT